MDFMENYYIYITYKDTEHYSLQLEGETVYIGAFPRGKRPCKIGEKILIYALLPEEPKNARKEERTNSEFRIISI